MPKKRDLGPMTEEDRAVVQKLRELCHYGYSPSFAELAAAMGYKSRNSVRWHLDRARAAGVVDWTAGRTRSLRVL